MDDYCVCHRSMIFHWVAFSVYVDPIGGKFYSIRITGDEQKRIQLRSSLITEDSRVMEVNLLSIPWCRKVS